MKIIEKIVLGTAQFGLNYGISNKSGKPSQSHVFEILNLAYEAGIRVLDTADAYGDALNVIGAYHKSCSKRFLVNTKFTKSNERVGSQLSNALSILNIEKVNTYFFHRFQDFIEFPELSDELVDLKKRYLINKIGLSVYGNDQLEIAIKAKNIDVIQVPFNLLDNQAQKGMLLRSANSNNKEIQARSIFLQGLFFMDLVALPKKLKVLRPYLNQIRNISKGYQVSIEELALKYVVNQDYIESVVIGVDSCLQLEDNIRYLVKTHTLPAQVEHELNQIVVNDESILNPTNWI